MKYKLYTLLIIALCFVQACADKQPIKTPAPIALNALRTGDKPVVPISKYNNTKGYWDDGRLAIEFDCPDSKFFAPIDMRSWRNTPVVNGRFPTYEETMNGTAIHHYGEKSNRDIKPYDMILPRLATLTIRNKLVVVIQIAQTAKDTVVSYRYLTGGCGGSAFHNFHFLSDEEVMKAENNINWYPEDAKLINTPGNI